jgi:hypothetical protein
MDLNFRADVNPPDWCNDRQRALFYAICDECDHAGVKLEPLYEMGLAVFASVLSAIESSKTAIRQNVPPQGDHVVNLFDNFVLALSMAEQFQLNHFALSNLLMLTSPEAIAMQQELLAMCKRPKTH